jgi:hypothetical protein
MKSHSMNFEKLVFTALAVVTTTTVAALIHAVFSMQIVA